MTGKPLHSRFEDAWLLDGVRTPFVDYNGALATTSPIDLGIKVARAVFERTGISAGDVGTVIAGSMAQASFDAYMLPRHIGLYSGVPTEVPAHLVQRVCGTGIEVLMQAADTISLGRADLALCVGAESMSRNPIAAYTHRGGFRLGQVEFKDFLWEALLDPAADATMGDTAENLARQYQITRPEVDRYAARSFDRAIAAQASGFLAGEIVAVKTETFAVDGLNARGIKLRGKSERRRQRHPCAALAGRGAGQDPAGLRRRADRRQFLGHRRWRGGGAGRVVRLCQTRRARSRSRGSWPASRSACRRISWASGRCPPSGRCSRRRASSSRISIASRSTRPSARR